MPSATPSLGLVLSGGAARGSYEAGVLRFLFVDLARRLGRPTWPDVVSGTSVGALNGVFAAARDADGLAVLTDIWQRLRIEQVYRLAKVKALLDVIKPGPGTNFALLDPTPFHGLVTRGFPAAALRRAIGSGATRGFIVAATEVATGFNTLFVDAAPPGIAIVAQAGSRVYRTEIGAVHCRASAAIPFVFPAVEIGGRFHVDGGLRQNTPLRPVLQSGVERALIIGVKQDREMEARARQLQRVPGDARDGSKRPSLLFLAGKMLNALMLDPIERDLWSAEYRNHVVDWGIGRFGPGFEDAARQGLGLRKVGIVHLRPSEDLGRLAGTLYRARPPKASGPIRFLLDRVLAYTNDIEADFLSYLYFDSDYTGALEALGYEDARRHEDQLARLYDKVEA